MSHQALKTALNMNQVNLPQHLCRVLGFGNESRRLAIYIGYTYIYLYYVRQTFLIQYSFTFFSATAALAVVVIVRRI